MASEIVKTPDGKFKAKIGFQNGAEGLGVHDTLEAAQDALIAAEWAYNHIKITREECPGVHDGIGSLPRAVAPIVEALRFYADQGNDRGEAARKALRFIKGVRSV